MALQSRSAFRDTPGLGSVAFRDSMCRPSWKAACCISLESYYDGLSRMLRLMVSKAMV